MKTFLAPLFFNKMKNFKIVLMIFALLGTLSASATQAASAPTAAPNCRDWIADHVALIHNPASGSVFDIRRKDFVKDLKMQKTIVQRLQAFYDLLPPPMQKIFCTLEVIRINLDGGNFQSNGFVGIGGNLVIPSDIFFDKVTPNSMNIGLENQVDFTFYAKIPDAEINPVVWFSSSLDPLKKTTPIDLNLADATVPAEHFTMLMHELGHLLDFYNGITKTQDDCVKVGDDCKNPPKPNSWTSLSWVFDDQSIFEQPDAKTGAAAICPDRPLFEGYFNGTWGQLPAPLDKSDAMMKELYNTSFLSPAAATSPQDDWAESLKFYFMYKMLKPGETIAMVTQDGKVFDMKDLFNSPRFAAKKQFIEKFFSRTDLSYPTPDASED